MVGYTPALVLIPALRYHSHSAFTILLSEFMKQDENQQVQEQIRALGVFISLLFVVYWIWFSLNSYTFGPFQNQLATTFSVLSFVGIVCVVWSMVIKSKVLLWIGRILGIILTFPLALFDWIFAEKGFFHYESFWNWLIALPTWIWFGYTGVCIVLFYRNFKRVDVDDNWVERE